jgi:hypothetical protein
MTSLHHEPPAHLCGQSWGGHLSRRTFLGHALTAAMSSTVALTALAGRSHMVTAARSGSLAESVQNPLLVRSTPPPPLDITAFFPELAPLSRPAVRLHPRRGDESGPGESKVGGTFLWPSDEPWPLCSVGHVQSEPQHSLDADLLHDEVEEAEAYRRPFGPDIPPALLARPVGQPHGAYVGLIQLWAADVPELGFPQGCDLFQLLWCPRYHDHVPNHGLTHRCLIDGSYDWHGPACRVYWRDSRTIATALKENPVPAHFTPEFVPHLCQLFPERIHEYPASPDLPDELRERIWNWEETEAAAGYNYNAHLSVALGMKVGGHALWNDGYGAPCCASCQQEMELLLTICGVEWDGGNPYDKARWRPLEEQHLTVNRWQDDPTLLPTGIGSAGLHVFVCRRCPGWPTAYLQIY